MKIKELVNPYSSTYFVKDWLYTTMLFFVNMGISIILVVLFSPFMLYSLLLFGLLLMYTPNVLWYFQSKY